MQEISIDFDVFKALTARRKNARHSMNDVIRELLDLNIILEPDDVLAEVLDPSGPVRTNPLAKASGFSARGIFLPNGTAIRATYKTQQHFATIVDGRWLDDQGQVHASPSAAAKNITGSNVNGIRFWQAKRPSDTDWRRLELLK